MKICKGCGKAIDTAKCKDGKEVAVDYRMGYFIPDEIRGLDEFVTPRGEVRRGRRASDGIKGRLIHKCRS